MTGKRKQQSLKIKQQRAGYFFIFPLILGVIVIFLPNIIMTLQFSLNEVIIKGSDGYELSSRGLAYYIEALTVDPRFIPSLVESYQSMFINVPVILIFSIFIASILNQKFRGRAVARAIFFIPVLLATGILDEIDSSIVAIMSGASLNTGSTIDSVLKFDIGNLLAQLNFNKTLINVIEMAVSNIYNVLKLSGMQIYIFLAGLQEIPKYLYEAAEIEGCSKWESFWKITFPMISPQMAVNVVYTLVVAGQGSSVLGYANMLSVTGKNYGLGTAMVILYLISLAFVLTIIFMMMKKLLQFRGE